MAVQLFYCMYTNFLFDVIYNDLRFMLSKFGEHVLMV